MHVSTVKTSKTLNMETYAGWCGAVWCGVECVCVWWWCWWFRCEDNECVFIHTPACVHRIGGKTPGSQTPGVPATWASTSGWTEAEKCCKPHRHALLWCMCLALHLCDRGLCEVMLCRSPRSLALAIPIPKGQHDPAPTCHSLLTNHGCRAR